MKHCRSRDYTVTAVNDILVSGLQHVNFIFKALLARIAKEKAKQRKEKPKKKKKNKQEQ